MKFSIRPYFLPFWSFILNLPMIILALPIRSSRITEWRIQEHTVHLDVDENCPAGTPLGTVNSLVSSVQNGYFENPQLQVGVKYQFGAPSSLFTVNEQTGLVSTMAVLDAEELCKKAREEEQSGKGTISEQRRDNNHLFDIVDRVTCSPDGNLTVHADINALRPDASLLSIFQTRIHIRDLNDNSPTFDPPRWYRSLKEALYQKGRRLDLPKARDDDISPRNNQINYRLEPYTEDVRNTFGPFRLEVSPMGQPSLVLVEDLDAELHSEYHLVLFAYSPVPMDGAPDTEANLKLDIEVIDMNDNEPRFSKELYKVSVSEDTAVGSVIFQLIANDPDKSANLTYAIKTSEMDLILSSTFRVMPDGRVQLTGPLDYEGQRSYEIPVQVRDGEFTAYAVLTVQVMDTNDEPPRFELNPKHIIASEHASPGMLIGQLRIYDSDGEDVNGNVRCFEPTGLERSQPLAFLPDPRQQPYSSVYDLTTRLFLDRESDDYAKDGRLFVYLVCVDGNDVHSGRTANRQHTSTMTITLTIQDENDHSPLFDQTVYHAQIPENNEIGEKIIQVQATDMDEGPNAQVVYSLLDRTNFEVDPVSGWISANRIYDREERDSYQVTVIASDQGVPQISSSVLLNLTILDQNDHAPRLVSTNEHGRGESDNRCNRCTLLYVYENSPANTLIGNLQALDEDSAENSEVHFRMLEDNEPLIKTQFRLLRNGSLYTAIELDREEKEGYIFTVLLTDQSIINALSTTGTVTIIVRDENDNPPVFVGPKVLLNADHIESLQSAHSENAHWLYDQPLTDSKEVKYSQEKEAILVEKSDPHISDVAYERNSSTEQNSIRVSVHEEPGYLIATLQATDPDKDENGQIVYRAEEVVRIRENFTTRDKTRRGMLWTNSDLGHIVLRRQLDKSDLGVHFIRVTASDRSVLKPLKVSKLLILLVEDIPKSKLGSIYPLDSTVMQESQTAQGAIWGSLLITAITVISFVVIATILTTIILCSRRHNRGDSCFQRKQNESVVKLKTEQHAEKSNPFTFQNPSDGFEKRADLLLDSKEMTQEDQRVVQAHGEHIPHTFLKSQDEIIPLNIHSEALNTSITFFETEAKRSPNNYADQAINVTPDLIIPKESKLNQVLLSKKDNPCEFYGKQCMGHDGCSFSSSIPTSNNAKLTADCTGDEIEKATGPYSEFKGGFLIATQPVFEHLRQISSPEIHPLKVSFNPTDLNLSGPSQSVLSAEQLVAIPSVSCGMDTKHVLFAATTTNPSPSFSTVDQIELVNIFVDPEQIFSKNVINVVSGKDSYDEQSFS
ncbi:Protocadherin gamma-B5 [Fasciola hepatica]|uniref:Protocadherin gamma-B5 n=1 Tax=Fasciola hepatica TaxID=6192 RepID=A0A4E0RI73_FASHE|nr:Protocadherin gamma-B5 [Fasciola hepatica]